MQVDILSGIIHATDSDDSIDPLPDDRKLALRRRVLASIVDKLDVNRTYSIRITDNGGKSPTGGYEYIVTVLAFADLDGPI